MEGKGEFSLGACYLLVLLRVGNAASLLTWLFWVSGGLVPHPRAGSLGPLVGWTLDSSDGSECVSPKERNLAVTYVPLLIRLSCWGLGPPSALTRKRG